MIVRAQASNLKLLSLLSQCLLGEVRLQKDCDVCACNHRKKNAKTM